MGIFFYLFVVFPVSRDYSVPQKFISAKDTLRAINSIKIIRQSETQLDIYCDIIDLCLTYLLYMKQQNCALSANNSNNHEIL